MVSHCAASNGEVVEASLGEDDVVAASDDIGAGESKVAIGRSTSDATESAKDVAVGVLIGKEFFEEEGAIGGVDAEAEVVLGVIGEAAIFYYDEFTIDLFDHGAIARVTLFATWRGGERGVEVFGITGGAEAEVEGVAYLIFWNVDAVGELVRSVVFIGVVEDLAVVGDAEAHDLIDDEVDVVGEDEVSLAIFAIVGVVIGAAFDKDEGLVCAIEDFWDSFSIRVFDLNLVEEVGTLIVSDEGADGLWCWWRAGVGARNLD